MSGSVIPAQNVRGSITSSAIAVEPTLKNTKPPALRFTESSSHAMRSKETP
jgi:hypothetical protein